MSTIPDFATNFQENQANGLVHASYWRVREDSGNYRLAVTSGGVFSDGSLPEEYLRAEGLSTFVHPIGAPVVGVVSYIFPPKLLADILSQLAASTRAKMSIRSALEEAFFRTSTDCSGPSLVFPTALYSFLNNATSNALGLDQDLALYRDGLFLAPQSAVEVCRYLLWLRIWRM